MNLEELKNASCYEELEILLTLQGLQGKRRKVFDLISNYKDSYTFCIPTKSGYVWYSNASLKRIEALETVNGDFSCSTQIISFKGAPEKVNGDFVCLGCTSLTSFANAPKKVGGNFDCSWCNSLSSLEGAPKKVSGYFDCSRCTSLTSLEGAPREVGGHFDCSRCTSLTSLAGAPRKVRRFWF